MDAVGTRSARHVDPIDVLCRRIDDATRAGQLARHALRFSPEQVMLVDRAFLWVSKDDLASEAAARFGVANGSSERLRREQFRARYGITHEHADLLRRSLRTEVMVLQLLMRADASVDLRVHENLECVHEMRREWTPYYEPMMKREANPVLQLLDDTLALANGDLPMSPLQGNPNVAYEVHDADVHAAIGQSRSWR
jgi:hypothetical protein